jgi:FkbM family methyltransferase
MRATQLQKAATYFRANSPWRRALPNRTVRRHVQGVDLYLPWSHLLPDYARACPAYGQNLVELASQLNERLGDAGPIHVLDVGANVGDSAAQIVARTAARVLCVEGDPYWADYLRRNVGSDSRITIAEVFLTYPDSSWSGASPVRNHGTTHFVEDAGAAAGLVTVSVAKLREQYPDFDTIRLVKTDTDGLDVALAPEIAKTWQDQGPVVFFEYDPRLSRNSGFSDPSRVFAQLAELGYTHAALWDNGGTPLGQLDVADAPEQARVLDTEPDKLGYYFWDVAVRRADDTAAAEVFDRLVPGRFTTV